MSVAPSARIDGVNRTKWEGWKTRAQVSDLDLGDTFATAISENLTVGAAHAPATAAPAPNATVVTIRSARSVADITAYNISACMVGRALIPFRVGLMPVSIEAYICFRCPRMWWAVPFFVPVSGCWAFHSLWNGHLP